MAKEGPRDPISEAFRHVSQDARREGGRFGAISFLIVVLLAVSSATGSWRCLVLR